MLYLSFIFGPEYRDVITSRERVVWLSGKFERIIIAEEAIDQPKSELTHYILWCMHESQVRLSEMFVIDL